MTARAMIRKDPVPDPAYPWYYTVEHEPPREDSLDYGSLSTQAEAMQAVEHVLTHPDAYVEPFERRALLAHLAEKYVDDPRRPCCDAETTLADWVAALTPTEYAAAAAELEG